jgi:2-polyprenyl-3-methyl-5-hydroxy-6-metoxy-1,4-benzoquinol methylase
MPSAATAIPGSAAEARAHAALRKTRLKFFLRRWIGEIYVGKRMKMRHLTRLVRKLPLPRAPRLLEVGCEDGTFCDWLTRLWPNATVEGLDRNASQIQACSRWAHGAGRSATLRFRHGDILELDAPECYDLIICFDVLGYIPDDRGALRRIANALKPDGWLVVHQPNTTYQRLDGSFHHVSPEQAHLITDGHVRHGYRPDELRELLLHTPGLNVHAITPLHGRLTDLAYAIYVLLEHPAPLRVLALPFIDLLCEFDRRLPQKHGNTVCAIARKASH